MRGGSYWIRKLIHSYTQSAKQSGVVALFTAPRVSSDSVLRAIRSVYGSSPRFDSRRGIPRVSQCLNVRAIQPVYGWLPGFDSRRELGDFSVSSSWQDEHFIFLVSLQFRNLLPFFLHGEKENGFVVPHAAFGWSYW